MDDGNRTTEKAKGTKKSVIKRTLTFNDYIISLLNNKIILKPQQIFQIETHVYTEKINKVTLSSNHDKRLKRFDRVTLYPYASSARKLCKTEILSKYK